jgi:hypothetical protein
MNVDDVVAERIEQARRRIEANKRRRATQQAARQAGLIARHRVKLARLEADSVRATDGKGLAQTETPALSATEPTEGTTP